jgi:hypothetical protein
MCHNLRESCGLCIYIRHNMDISSPSTIRVRIVLSRGLQDVPVNYKSNISTTILNIYPSKESLLLGLDLIVSSA